MEIKIKEHNLETKEQVLNTLGKVSFNFMIIGIITIIALIANNTFLDIIIGITIIINVTSTSIIDMAVEKEKKKMRGQ